MSTDILIKDVKPGAKSLNIVFIILEIGKADVFTLEYDITTVNVT